MFSNLQSNNELIKWMVHHKHSFRIAQYETTDKREQENLEI